ncbi:hypothetical protein [Rubellicoccus peritrichatus]|uniref:Verru_Chthon cassette protein A n=1 Tax=Rubellicoccus peritrichatus TaxID=3080537 RepID=A0AAQ3L8H7_9BACT|nr:hypothetical protein [Puniceicoccus sp. CR14]WOO41046.1 hypothetical protein RZN69_20695 [Puniceicoccus sp. CR14]
MSNRSKFGRAELSGRSAQRLQRRNGFALIVAIGMLGFIVLILYSLSISTLVQTSTVTAQKAHTQAKLNALVGLNVALGNLQKQMGPDQRASASSWLLKSDGDPSTSALGAADDDPRRHWVGVWNTSEKAFDPGDSNYFDKTWVRNPNAEHMGWLVSKYDDSTYAGSIPQINTTLDADFFPVDPDVALLAGMNSLGGTNPGASVDVNDFVFAPKVDIEKDNAVTSDKYAYWISDEGQKAPINLVDDRYLDAASTGTRNNLMAPDGVGIASISGLGDYNLEDTSSGQAQAFDRVLYFSDAGHIENSAGADWGDVLPGYFHDIGLSSTMLQVDVRNGGLKKDLSFLFESDDADFNSSPFGGNPDSLRLDNPETDGSAYFDEYIKGPVSYLFKYPILDISNDAFVRGPTWHFLRDYYRLYKDIEEEDSNPVIASRSYRPNTVDYNYIAASDRYSDEHGNPTLHGMRLTYTNIMDSKDSSKSIDSRNNFVNVEVLPIQANEINQSPEYANIPRLTAHEVAPVVVRMFMVYSFVNVTPPDGVYRIDRDADGNPLVGVFNNGLQNPYQWQVKNDGPGSITAVKVQPIAVVWNPYNTRISFNAYKVQIGQPQFGIDLSWDEPISPSNPSHMGYNAAIGNIMSTAMPYNAGRASGTFRFIIGNPPDGSDSIVLEPGEQRIFSAAETYHNEEIEVGDQPLFLEPGWDTSGGIVLYRASSLARTRTFTRARNGGAGESQNNVPSPVVDNIPSQYAITLNDVYWVSDNRYRESRLDDDATIISQDWQDFLMTDTDSIAEGGDFLSEDHILRSIGGAYTKGSDSSIHDAFDSVGGYTLYPHDIGIGNGFPFMAIEVRLNPANTDAGVPSEMLGRTNPFAYLGLAKHSAETTAERYTVEVHDMHGAGSYNALRPESYSGGDKTYFGYGYSVSNGSQQSVLQEIPTAPLWSLGSLQHANISRSAYLPRNAIGNSQAPPYFASNELDLNEQLTNGYQNNNLRPTLYDISYLSNEALYDSYFFSSLSPESGNLDLSGQISSVFDPTHFRDGNPNLSNRRFAYIGEGNYADAQAELSQADGYLKTAAYWAPEGGFNVNSTSVTAWKAFIASNFGHTFDYYEGDGSFASGTADGAMFSRVALPNADIGTDSNAKDDWNAPIQLSDAEIDALAGAIVQEVKTRGPFLSLSDFINRRPGSTDNNQQLQGVLARAIDVADINDDISQNGDNFGDDWGLVSDLYEENAVGNSATGIPGWLTQADLLTPLAPYISVRSDTFVIRAYGEVAGFNDQVEGRAWCEALVQRLPDYVDSAENEPWDDVSAITPNGLNDTFGRGFKIVQFRWLNKDDV